ncbi:hypothetical protein K523DRAFT_288260 [Schizophyllum commune Tattone D]|nr:hypothetical protein K523DRAFT_288260 [Schizophyllum commune Tattone D]
MATTTTPSNDSTQRSTPDRMRSTRKAIRPSPSPVSRPWQQFHPPVSRHLILGWVITPEMYHRFCKGDSHCPTYLHGKPEGYDNDYHEEALQEVVCDLLGERYQLPCAGYKLVYVDPTLRNRDIEFALVLTDNQGQGEAQRSLPDPAVVDALKKELGTEEEPKWLLRVS